MDAIEIINPARQSLIIDGGRQGKQHLGRCQSGPMDKFAYQLGQMLAPSANGVVLEICGDGFTLKALQPLELMVTGAEGQCLVDQDIYPLWSTITVLPEQSLQISSTNTQYFYIHIVNIDIHTTRCCESYSTVTRENCGGLSGNGRPLVVGDKIKGVVRKTAPISIGNGAREKLHWLIQKTYAPRKIRVIPGSQFCHFGAKNWHRFLSETYSISPASNRMGFRLTGKPISSNRYDIRSEGLTFGSIQIPADGQPIILLADRQTLGGYPKIGNVAIVDLPYTVQQNPGTQLNFTEIDHHKALYYARLSAKQIRQFQESK